MAPGAAGVTVVEVVTERSTNPQLQDRTIAGVTKPSVLPYLAAKPNGAAAIVLPGGGYTYLAYDKEGTEIATWLNSWVSLPSSSSTDCRSISQRDLGGAGGHTTRDASDSKERRCLQDRPDPHRRDRVFCGRASRFSARDSFQARLTPAMDEVDAIDARPAFGVLMYPVISMDPAIAHAGSKKALLGANPTAAAVALDSSELQVTAPHRRRSWAPRSGTPPSNPRIR